MSNVIAIARLKRMIFEKAAQAQNITLPMDVREQEGFLFQYRHVLQLALLVFDEIDEQEKHNKRLLEGNEVLHKILEGWIAEMNEKDRQIEYLAGKLNETTELLKRYKI